MADTSTLVGLPSLARVRRARTGRRVFLVLLFAFIALGLGERFGVRSAHVANTANGYTLRVTYAAVTRPGLDTPFVIQATRDDGRLPDTLTIAVDMAYLDLFDKNGGLDPDPTESSSDASRVYWTFNTAGRRTLNVSLDAILAMGREWGHGGHVVLIDHGHRVAGVTFRTWVTP